MSTPPRLLRAVSLAGLVLFSAAALAAKAPVRVDIGKTDLTTVADFRGDAAELLGLHLGQIVPEAMAAVKRHPDLETHEDEANPGRWYVMDKGGGGGDPTLFYLQWPDGRTDMGRMVVYGRAARFMPDGASRFFRAHTHAEMPKDVKEWLGPPDRSVVTLDIPSIDLKITSHVFEKRAIEVSDYSSGDVIIAFVHPDVLVR